MRFRVRHVRVPLLSPFSNSGGTTLARSALVLELEHAGVTAFSECIAGETPSFTGEDNRTALHDVQGFAERLRREPPSPEEFLEGSGGLVGHQMSKAAVEMLLWDHRAKLAGRPLHRELGHSRGYAEAGVSIGLGEAAETVSRVGEAVARGYKRVKLKVRREGAVEMVASVRDAFPEPPLSVDANGCFSLPGDMALLKRLDSLELQYIEQPLGFDDLEGHAALAKELSTPICLDESVTSLRDAEDALRMGAAAVLNVKPGRVGGLSVALGIARLAREQGAHVWVGGMLETGVGRAFNVALASQPEVDYPGDISPNDRYFARDIVSNPFEMKGGTLSPNEGAGIGIEVDRATLGRFTVRIWELL